MKTVFALTLLLIASNVDATSQRRFLDEEPSECDIATSNITDSDTYTEMSDILDEDIMSILNNTRPDTNLCQPKDGDGFVKCQGTLSPFLLNSYENLCNSVAGQLLTLENVRITCNPKSANDDDQTYTQIEQIPLCIGSADVCDDDDASNAIKDQLKSLGKMGVKLNGQPGSCKALEGSSAFTASIASAFMIVSFVTSYMLL